MNPDGLAAALRAEGTDVNVLSLFSGIGGLDLGLERAGMTVVGQVEIDPWCRKVLEKHWPEVPRHDDVRTAARWWGDRRAPDLVCGGFPCQPVSVAGLGLAQADERWLWPAFAGTVRHLRPRYVFVENVPGLLGRGMGDVLGDLAGLGYDAEWDCLSAADFGAPHLRKRIWIAAYAQRGQLRHEPGWRDGAHRPGPAVAGDDGTLRLVANPASSRCAAGPRGAGEPARDEARRPRPDGLGGDVADPDRRRFAQQPERHGEPQPRIFTSSWYDAKRRYPHAADSDGEPLGRPSESRRERGQWTIEPGVGRVADGVSGRVDRLRGLGNAVVPQVAEHIGRLILAAERAA